MRVGGTKRSTALRSVKILDGTLALTVMLVSCGGCGGSGGAAVAPGSVAKTPALSGTLDVVKPASTILESEPNGTVDQTHFLGALHDGSSWTVVGEISRSGTADDLDGYRLVVPERLRVEVTLSTQGALATKGVDSNLSLGLYDATSMQYVQTAASEATPKSVQFHAKGTTVFVVRPTASDSSRYTLTVTGLATAKVIHEEEPNDVPGEAVYLGELSHGDVISIAGELDELGDEVDRLLFSCPASVEVTASLSFDELVDFDFVLSDATLDYRSPTEIGRFETDKATKEEGSAHLGAMTLLAVEVLTARGSGTYELDVRASESGSGPLAKLATANWSKEKRLAPLSAEYRDESLLSSGSRLAHFGRVASQYRPGQFLLRADARFDGSSELGRRHCRVVDRVPGGVCRVELELPDGLSADEQRRFTTATIETLSGYQGVLYCEPNYSRTVFREPNDELYNLQWNHSMLELPRAWDVSIGDPSVVVAVVDTGTTGHPDLQGRQLPGYDFISDPLSARDGDGPDPDPTDNGDLKFIGSSTFHGTHVAAIIGAETGGSGEGVAGVAWEVRILPLRVAGTRDATDFDVANAILYAAGIMNSSGVIPGTQADIVNISLGGPDYSQTVQDAVAAARSAGVLVFAAAGNGGSSSPQYPASYDGVISVGAVGSEATRAPYSNYGDHLDIVAPGGDRLVDRNGDGHPDSIVSASASESEDGVSYSYGFYSGTSMACAHASGVAALMFAVDPTLTPEELEGYLLSTALDLGSPGRDDYYGHGLINAFRSVVAAADSVPLPPILGLTTTEVAVVDSLESRISRISNIGGGLLEVYSLEVFLEEGEDWLSARRVVDVDAVDSDTVGVRLIVDADGLPDGIYVGEVKVHSNGGAGSIRVVLRLPTTTFVENVELSVVIVDAETRGIVDVDRVYPTGSLRFEFHDVPPGDYLVFSGSDDNGDGIVCGKSDRYCGAYPRLDQPYPVTFEVGAPVVNLDFPVTVQFGDSGGDDEGGFDLSD